jgi:hypothetical protein
MSDEYDVAVPVTVQIRDGQVIGAYVDFEGAPWMGVDSDSNVYDNQREEWIRDEGVESRAIEGLAAGLPRGEL